MKLIQMKSIYYKQGQHQALTYE